MCTLKLDEYLCGVGAYTLFLASKYSLAQKLPVPPKPCYISEQVQRAIRKRGSPRRGKVHVAQKCGPT
jgi:hypothetical protein